MVNTDSEGRLAVGVHAYLNPASVGQHAVYNPDISPYSLVIGRSAKLINGGIKNGLIGANYGAVLELPEYYPEPVYAAEGETIIDFTSAKAELVSKSISLFNVDQTNDYKLEEDALNFSSSNTDITIFKITSTEIEKANIINIDVPTSATVVINLIGEELTLANKAIKLKQNGSEQGDDQMKAFSSMVLWNMPNIKKLNIGGFGMQGSVLMPQGDFICTGWGQINGTLVANNYYSGGSYISTDIPNTVNGAVELHDHPFKGVIDTSPDPDPTPTPEVTPTPDPDPDTGSIPTIELIDEETPLANVERPSNPDSEELQSEKAPQPTIALITEQIPQTGESTNQAIVRIILLVLSASTVMLMYAIKKSKPAKG